MMNAERRARKIVERIVDGEDRGEEVVETNQGSRQK